MLLQRLVFLNALSIIFFLLITFSFKSFGLFPLVFGKKTVKDIKTRNVKIFIFLTLVEIFYEILERLGYEVDWEEESVYYEGPQKENE